MAMYLKIDGIQGDVTDEKYKGQIEVTELHWGVDHANEGAPGTRQAQLTGKANCSPVVLHKHTDGSSPQLIGKTFKGETIKDAVIAIVSPDADRRELIKYTLTEVQVGSVHTEVAPNGALHEVVALRYAR